MSEKLIKNNSYTFTIESLCGNGNGVAKYGENGFVVFIPCTAKDDIVKAKIIKLAKNYAVGKLEEIITPSPSRISSGCPHMAQCGGCSFQHISYEAECEIKKNMINDSFSHIGGLDLEISGFVGADSSSRYRNKAMYPVAEDKNGKLISGFYAAMSHRIKEHEDCLIGAEIFSKIKNSAVEILENLGISAYNEETKKGIIRCIYMRKNTKNEVLLTFIVNADTLGETKEKALCDTLTKKHSEIKGILINTNRKEGNSLLGNSWRTLWGDEYLYDTLCERKFRIAPGAFYQVNHDQTQKLYYIAKEFADIKEGDTVFDLYCGTGTIGIILAEKGIKLVGVEISKDAVKDASENAKLNGIDAEFICLDTGEALNTERLLNKKPDVIIIDPPRKGCGDDAVEKISSFGANRIVYISCNPQTLARDLVKFKSCGYEAEKAVGVDLFPRTGHVECVVKLTSNKNNI